VFDELVGRWANGSAGLGGWSLSSHHAYDPLAAVAYYGDGERQSAVNLNPMLSAVKSSAYAQSIASNPDGSVIYNAGAWIYRVGRDGTTSVFAGTGSFDYSGDSLPATSAAVFPDQLARGPDGSTYFTDFSCRVRRIDPAGILTTIGGTEVQGSTGDGGPALQATFWCSGPIAVGPDGSVYVIGSNSPFRGSHVRRIGPDGIVTRFTGSTQGSCQLAACPDSVPALNAPLGTPGQLAVLPNGDVLIGDFGTIWKVSTSGLRTRLTKAPTSFTCVEKGDGIPAVEASICDVNALATGADGSIYVATTKHVRRISPDGIITTVAGNGKFCALNSSPRCPAQPSGGALQLPLPQRSSAHLASARRLRSTRTATSRACARPAARRWGSPTIHSASCARAPTRAARCTGSATMPSACSKRTTTLTG
jgi:hypothetical protein